ncbi:hypothetical protein SUGI_0775270 [Cryptomeria japonica]|uniref:cinnamoyl-CoA reductase 1 n=1 Tax=Cryptomeria japonica TaxID=3369 RepID=UPI002414C316|nr:cinnamoyl-CoA reductase 1 [Cryptomeria japonica]GLJ38084.1 hypothetical protein SUGI_0775270 [Cryptomeria japonica]
MDHSKFVCITGSWSFLSISIAKMLLARGYSVRFTVPLTADEASSLMDCEEKASGKLELGEADLLDYGSVFHQINGCSGVFHVPAPCDLIGVQDYPSDSIEYEIRSALNVVEACATSESVKRLIFTSSVSAIVWRGQGGTGENQVLDERCWTNPDFCRQNKLWSPLTKTLSEKAVWALSNDRGLNLVVVNLASVVDKEPSKHNAHNLVNQLKGSMALQQNGVCAYVEVEEATLAHIAAFEYEDAKGRYICLERMLTNDEIKEILWSSYKTSNDGLEEWIRPLNLSNQKFLKLKRQYSGELA